MASLLAPRHRETNETATKVPPCAGQKQAWGGGLNRFDRNLTFPLIFRRGLHNLVGCSAPKAINMSSREQLKYCGEARIMTRQLQRVEIPGDPWGVSNTTETLEQKKTTSWTPMGQETDKCPKLPRKCHNHNSQSVKYRKM